MDTTRFYPFLISTCLLLGNAAPVSAHLSYGGRNFGTFSGTQPESKTITGQTVPTNWGWADATDGDFGHTHRVRFFRFTLTATAEVTISVLSLNPSAMLPAFSLYAGLGSTNPPDYETDLTFDYLATLPGPAKEGAFNALDTWRMGNDESTNFSTFSTFTYVGNAADGTASNFGNAAGIKGDGIVDGSVSGTFTLPAGDYTLVIGGATYAGQGAGPSIGDGGNQGADITPDAITTSVTVVPEPAAGVLVCGGLCLLAAVRRRAV